MKTLKTIVLDQTDLEYFAKEVADSWQYQIQDEGLNTFDVTFDYGDFKFTVTCDVDCTEEVYQHATIDEPKDSKIVVDYADITDICIPNVDEYDIDYSSLILNDILEKLMK